MSKFSHRLGGKANFSHTTQPRERDSDEKESEASKKGSVRLANGFNWNSLGHGAPQGKGNQRERQIGEMNVSLIIFTQCSPAVERIMEH